MTAVLDTVMKAYEVGICPIRASTDGSKKPVGNWKGYQAARPFETELHAWFKRGHSGWGAVCGAVSGNLEMLEVEGRAVSEGIVPKLITRATETGVGDVLERITNGYTEKTPSGGIHWLYRCDQIDGNLRLARDETGEVLIETRGQGGFVILAPSNGRTHPTGKPWELVTGGLDTIATITPEERAALHTLCRGFDQVGDELHREDRRDLSDSKDAEKVLHRGWELVDSRPGDEFDATHTCDEVLLDAGFVAHSTTQGGTNYTRPGKARKDGSSATVWNDDRTCTLFSSSINAPTEYLDGHHKLSPFRLHAALNYGGDFSEAARAWRREHRNDGRDRVRGTDLEPPTGVDPETGEILTTHDTTSRLRLPDSFYATRPELAHISQAARSRMIGRDALLGVSLTRVAALSNYQLRIPAIVGKQVGLTFHAALVGPPGASKSSCAGTAQELLPGQINPLMIDMVPVGSGEGLIELLLEWVEDTVEDTLDGKTITKTVKEKRQTRHAANVYIDEGAVLGEIGGRRGSTLLPTIRSMWTSDTLGQANASAERKRILDGGSYVYGVALGIQPELAGPLLNDTAAGTPQRFVWFSALDPDIPDELPAWPGELGWDIDHTYGHGLTVDEEIVTEVRNERLAVMRGADRDPGDSHATLARLKVTALLAVLARRTRVAPSDWQLAAEVMVVSSTVRDGITNALRIAAKAAEDAATAKHVRRELTVDSSRETAALRSAARSVGNVVRRHDHDCRRTCLTKAIGSKYRALIAVDDAIAEAERRDWITPHGEHWVPGKESPQ
jgi:hypothetical protein